MNRPRRGFGYLLLATVGVLAGSSVLAAEDALVEKNDIAVTATDAERYLNAQVPEKMRSRVLAKEGNLREMIGQIYVIRQLARDATDSGVADDPEVRWKVKMAEQRALGKAYLDTMVARKIQDVDFDALAREEYKANPDKYRTEEQVRAAHVLINTSDRSASEAKALAEKVRKKALDGEDFAALAKEYSDGSSAEKGGDLGYFTRDRMVDPFAKAAFGLEKPGDVSDVVKTRFGYHVIKLADRKPAKLQPFEKVKPGIISSLREERRNQIRGSIISDIRGADGIDVDQAAVKALHESLQEKVGVAGK
ncbi:peptidylprolyl isomerase [Arhodomonas sp. AD133]|uniref:peptidylprolyl isomerase n=1 Tax=Arhodomonas sp. AD133 TaxID=3415009 RepID=UPI003EC0D51D